MAPIAMPDMPSPEALPDIPDIPDIDDDADGLAPLAWSAWSIPGIAPCCMPPMSIERMSIVPVEGVLAAGAGSGIWPCFIPAMSPSFAAGLDPAAAGVLDALAGIGMLPMSMPSMSIELMDEGGLLDEVAGADPECCMPDMAPWSMLAMRSPCSERVVPDAAGAFVLDVLAGIAMPPMSMEPMSIELISIESFAWAVLADDAGADCAATGSARALPAASAMPSATRSGFCNVLMTWLMTPPLRETCPLPCGRACGSGRPSAPRHRRSRHN